jgi:RNA-directed DNA polymerase
MIKTPISLQDLRRKIYIKAKIEPQWKFWGLYVHVCKMETLLEAYQLAKHNKGAPGIDGVTFEMIEANGVEQYLQEVQKELLVDSYRPVGNRKVQIAKADGKTRILGIPMVIS